MPLRLIELAIPSQELEKLPALLQDIRVVQIWTSESAGPGGMARILLDAEHTEALSDVLVRHFGSRDNFRLVSLPVEATVPPVEPPAESKAPGGEAAAPAKGGPQRISREELYEDVAQASRLTPIYVVTIVLSTVVAAVGLIRGDIAIVIGAMVIAPLLGPNVALSLASTLGDPDLARRSLRTIGVGVATTAALSMLLGAVLTIDPHAPELAARTRADVGDVILALAAGAAGALAFRGRIRDAGRGRLHSHPDERNLYQPGCGGDVPFPEGAAQNLVGGRTGTESHPTRRCDMGHHARDPSGPDAVGLRGGGLTAACRIVKKGTNGRHRNMVR